MYAPEILPEVRILFFYLFILKEEFYLKGDKSLFCTVHNTYLKALTHVDPTYHIFFLSAHY